MSLIFEHNKQSDQKLDRNIYNLIGMLKTGGGVAEFIAGHPELQKHHIFGFLEEANVDEGILSVFGDIFVNAARSNPLNVCCHLSR
jgi:hypothetical protein